MDVNSEALDLDFPALMISSYTVKHNHLNLYFPLFST